MPVSGIVCPGANQERLEVHLGLTFFERWGGCHTCLGTLARACEFAVGVSTCMRIRPNTR